METISSQEEEALAVLLRLHVLGRSDVLVHPRTNTASRSIQIRTLLQFGFNKKDPTMNTFFVLLTVLFQLAIYQSEIIAHLSTALSMLTVELC